MNRFDADSIDYIPDPKINWMAAFSAIAGEPPWVVDLCQKLRSARQYQNLGTTRELPFALMLRITRRVIEIESSRQEFVMRCGRGQGG